MHVFCHTYAYIQFLKIQKYVFEKYVFEKYEHVFVVYDWPKGKYAHAWQCGLVFIDIKYRQKIWVPSAFWKIFYISPYLFRDLKTNSRWIPTFLKFGFEMVWYSNGQFISLDKDWGIRPGLESRQSGDLPVEVSSWSLGHKKNIFS